MKFLKRFLLKKFSIKKKLFFIFFSTILLGILTPLKFTNAAWYDFIIKPVTGVFIGIPSFLIGLTLQITLSFAIFLASFSAQLLRWVIGLNVPLTHCPAGFSECIVNIGWTFTRDLMNVFFILILVFIAIAYILRLDTFGMKKALPKLIIIALLINFSQVFVGIIVDISQIIMNTFTAALSPGNVLGQIKGIGGNVVNGLKAVLTFNASAAMNFLVQTIVLIIFNFVLGYILFLYALVFIIRMVALWIITILAPIAFMAYVLPATKKFWDTWMKHLLSWSFVGMFALFFLSLGFYLLGQIQALPAGYGFIGWDSDVGFGMVEIITGLIPYLVVLVFLYIGYKLAKSSAPEGAKQIMGGVEKGLKMIAGSAVGAAALGAAAGITAGVLSKTAEGAAKLSGATGVVGTLSKPFTKPTTWAIRGAESTFTPRLKEYQASKRKISENEIGKIDKMAPADAEAYINAKTKTLPGGLKKQHRLQYQARMAEKGDLKFTNQEFQEDAAANAGPVIDNEDSYYRKQAMEVANNIPDEVFKNDPNAKNPKEGDDRFVHMKTFMKTGDDRVKAGKEAREELKKTKEEIARRISSDDATIEVGLKLKYITKDEVDKDRTTALAKAKASVTTKQITEFLENDSATATFVKDLKPEDIRKIADPDTLGTRVGLTLGNSKNLQRIQDNFGHKKFKGAIEGVGGLNSATNTPEKLEEFAKNVNPDLAQAMFTSPAYKEVDLEARNNMLDPDDRPTVRSDDFNSRIRIEKKTDANPALKLFYEDIKKDKKAIKGLEETLESIKISFREAVRKKVAASVIKKIGDDIAQKKVDIEEKSDEIKRKIEGIKGTKLEVPWKEIEELKK